MEGGSPEISLAQVGLLPWVLAVAAVSFTAVYFFNRRNQLFVSKRWSRTFFGLRVLVLAALLLAALHPILTWRQTQREKAGIVLAIDTSSSMNVRDAAQGPTRIREVVDFLQSRQEDFLTQLAEKGKLSIYNFDSRVYALGDNRGLESLRAEGEETDLAAIIEATTKEARANNTSHMVLVSDGVQTASGDVLQALNRAKHSIYTVGVGRPASELATWRDVSLERVKANDQALKEQEVVVRLTIRQAGFKGRVLPLTVLEGAARLATQEVALEDAPVKTVDVAFTPTQSGLQTYTLSVPHDARDAIEENDDIRFSMFINEAKLKVLYIEGALKWEYKFLRRYLDQDPYVEAAFLIRTGDDQFYRQGKLQPILSGGFPRDLAELEKFDVLIIGDLPRSYLDDKVLKLLDQFLKSKGGGVLFLGNGRTLSGDFKGTPLAQMLPVNLPSLKQPALSTPSAVKLPMTGRGNPVLRGIEEQAGRLSLEQVYLTGGAKGSATVLLQYANNDAGKEPQPLLATQLYSKGRTAILASDSLWRWNVAPSVGDLLLANRLWGQVLRWCANYDVEEEGDSLFIMVNSDQSFYDPGRPVRARAKVRQSLLDQAKVKVRLKRGDQIESAVPMERKAGGEFQVTLKPQHNGFYVLEVLGESGPTKQTEQIAIKVGNPFKERERIALDEDTLRMIAQNTNGGYYPLATAGQIVENIKSQQRVREHRTEVSIPESPWYFLAVMLVCGVEWSLRRKKRLI